ncbi:reverse transcriptase [Phytophthora megakarya]|uniref:Reverse transcriptase n=1 Tax=Phytophthora megakarya TaxID=4795 RepID=A0A225UHN9_9STRA|nr:reverse transcriptase [Phytophthora megakarya]
MANRFEAGKRRVQRASAAWHRENDAIGEALGKVPWKTLAEIMGTSTCQYILVYRFKLHALPLWIKECGAKACPNADCATLPNIDLAHVFWDCPMAQQTWTWVRSLFALLHDQHVDYGLEEIFSFQMKYPPSKCLQIRSDWMNDYPDSNNELTTDTISAISNKYWSYAVALALTTIWRSRVDQIFNSNQTTPTTKER